jgi:hypothetical protein
MEDKNIKEAGKVVLTDEELMEIVGGTGDQDGTLYTKGGRVDVFCRQFETIEECRSRPFCQWYDYGSKVCAPHPRANAILVGQHIS